MLLGIGLMSPGSALAEPTEDTQPPKLLSLSIEPNEVNVSASSQTVVVSAHITDDLSGVQNADVTFHAPNLSGSQAIAVAFERIEGSDTDGIYRAKVTIPRFAEAGAWTIIALNLVDNAKNFSQLNAEKLTAGGFPHSVKVNSEETVEDTEAPKIDELGVEPESIDTSAEERTVFAFAHITDDVSGLKEVRVTFVSPSGEQSVQGSATEPLEGSATNGSFKIPVDFPQTSEGGTWTISSIFLADHAGHERKLSAGQIEEMGLQRKVFVKAGGDTEAPQIQGLSIEPAEIYTHSSGQTVTLNAHITDDLSGFASGSIVFTSPSGEESTEGFEFKLVSGDAQNGGYEIQVPFKQGSESGTWLISDIRLADAAGNKRVLGPEEMEERGLSRKVRVESEEEFEDVVAPQMNELLIEPSSIDTSSSAQTVTLFAHIMDSYSGFKSGSVTFTSPSGKQMTSASEFKRVAGDAHEGTYEIRVPFERFSENGAWQISVIHLTDQVGNERAMEPQQIEEAALPHTVLVEGEEESEEPKDSEAPRLHGISIEPTEIDTSSEEQPVLVTAKVTDNESGFKSGEVMFISPSGKQELEGVEFKLVSGGETEGVYQVVATFPQGAEPGSWSVAKVRLRDHAGNERVIPGAEIEGSTTVFVKGGEEEAEDVEAPRIDELAIEPESIDTSAEERTVTLFAHITDDVTGLKEARVVFVSPSGKQSTQGFVNEPLEGSGTNGVFKIPVTFEQFSEAGTWTISSIWLGDHAGHERELGPKQIEELGLSHEVFVEGEGDTEPPQLHGLEIEPTEIDTSAEKQTVFVTAKITDNLSGFREGVVRFDSPSGEEIAVGAEFKLVAGNENEGLYRVEVAFGQESEAGEWNISSVTLVDQVGNKVFIPREEIEGAGMPHTVVVAGGAAPTITAVEPSSGPETGGTEVLISGSGLSGAKEVRFGSTPATEFSVKSANLVRAVSPPGTGTVDVTVTTAAGTSETSAADRFAYAPQVTLSSTPNPSVHGQKVTFTAKVIPAGGPTPIGTVAFTEGSNVLGVVNLSKGTATFNTTALSAGKHPIYASYSGDANYPAAQSAVITQNVEKASTQLLLSSSLNPAPYGSNATVKATVNALAPGAGTPAGTVTFREGETVIDTVQLNGHNASLSLKTMPPGEHVISASYSGDPNNQPSSGEPLTETIVNATTETSLTSSLNPAPFGSSATLKATVDSVAPSVVTPTGTVTFREGETVLAIVPLSAGGVAKYPLKTVAPGSYEITATYNGGEGFEGSKSTLTQTIVKASTELTLTSSKNPAPKGSSGNLKATVKAIAPGGGTPTGTVTFREGETVLATIPLSSNSATYPLKSLAVGTHNVTAIYNGSADYLESEGAISQVITP